MEQNPDQSQESTPRLQSKAKTRQKESNSEGSLQTERKRADALIADERARADISLHTSAQSKSEIGILASKRKTSDADLAKERKQTDASLERSAGLLATERSAHIQTQEALTSREELMAIVSHDLRNPIGAISSCSEMLLDDKDSLNTETANWITFIKRNADLALRLVSDLLDIERIAQGKLNLNLASCDLGQLVRDSIQNLIPSAAAKNILIRNTPIRTPISINCDGDRLAQVLGNLVNNAIKFTQEGGLIDVLTTLNEAGHLKITVSDNGTGIPADKLGSIFDRFSQLGLKDRRGIGLGLYISKSIIEAHGGKLSVKSEAGTGSTFIIEVPA